MSGHPVASTNNATVCPLFIYLTSEPVAHIEKHQVVGLLVKTFGKSLKFGPLKYESEVLPN